MTSDIALEKIPAEVDAEYVVEIRQVVALGGFPVELADYFIEQRMTSKTVLRLLLAAIKTIQ